MRMCTWGAESLSALRDLTDAALPGENLSDDELLAACLDPAADTAVVLAEAGGAAAVAVLISEDDEGRPAAAVSLLAVVPAAQGTGMGRDLLRVAREWAFDRPGVTSLSAGAAGLTGVHLWPGVDVVWTRALCLFEAGGFRAGATVLNLACPTTFRAAPPAEVEVRRVLEEQDATAAARLCAGVAPRLSGEIARAVEHGSCLLAVEAGNDAAAIGLACHSVNRVGWIGPVLVAPTWRRKGVGAAVLSAACADLRGAGHPDGQIAWAEPIEFFARSAGASVSRVYQRMVCHRP
jgi:mycothiol synthase